MLFGENGAMEAQSEDFNVEESANIFEASIRESCTAEEIEEFLADSKAVNEALRDEIVTERTIVRLDKAAKLSKSEKTAEFELAKRKNDKDYRKLLTVWKMERELEAKIHKKYGMQAKTLGKKMYADSIRKKRESKNNVVRKATANVKKQFNPEIKQKGTAKPTKTSKPVKPMSIGTVPLAKI